MNNYKIQAGICTAFFLLTFFFSANVHSQVSTGGVPPSFSIQTSSFRMASIPQFSLPKLDTVSVNQKIKQARKDCEGCRKEFYGKGFDVSIDVLNEGIKHSITAGNIWRYKIKLEDALAVQLTFKSFKLPEGGELYIYNENRTMVLGAFTSRNNRETAFPVQPVKGNIVTIEYFEPLNASFNTEIKLSKVIHVFKELYDRSGPFAEGGAEACNIDVVCALGNGWSNEIRSVGLILGYDETNQLYGICSGALINNTLQNGRPYFLSARHCLSTTSQDYLEWVVLFNHQQTVCGGDGSGAPITQSVSGTRLLSAKSNYEYAQTNGSYDYALLELYETIPASYNVCFAGWDNTEFGASSTSQTTGIHHPNHDVKKISRDNSAPQSSAYNNGTSDMHWAVSWDQGITASGSSGSPLFNSSHRIIGQLRGGASFCATPQATDLYGKFSKSWTEGNFGIWLSTSSNATTVNTYCPVYPTACQNGIKDGTETSVDCGGTCPPCPASCSDGIMNQNETGIDCGGSCPPCAASCYDGIRNQGEVQIDCGGPCTGCPPPSCNDNLRNQNETGIDCGGVCPPCSTFCGDGVFNGDELAVDCGGSCPVCSSLMENGSFQDHSCVLSDGIQGWPFNQDGAYCVEGPWYASHGGPALRKWSDGNFAIRFNSTEYFRPSVQQFMVKSDGVFYQFPFKLDPNKIYTLNFKYLDYIANSYSPMNAVRFFATYGLQSFTKVDPTETDFLPPSYPFGKHSIKDYFNAGGTPASNWENRQFDFTVPNNSYDQLWIHAYNYSYAQSTDWSFYYMDDIVLTARNKPCVTEVIFNNTYNLPEVTIAKNIVTQNSVEVSGGQRKAFKAVNTVTLNPGFKTELNSVFVALIAPCENQTPPLRLSNYDSLSYQGTKDRAQFTSSKPGPFKAMEPVEDITISEGVVIHVYPNPTSGKFNVETEGRITNGKYVIYNNMGQKVYNHIFSSDNQFVIDLTDQPKGVYILNVTSDNINRNVMIVVE